MDGLKKRLAFALLSSLLIANVAAADDGFFGSWFQRETVSVTIVEPFIEMRTGPGRGYPIFHVAERGETVEVLKERTDWYKVRNRKGKEGWVFADAMAKTLGADGKPLAIALPDFDDFTHRRFEGGTAFGDFEGADVASIYAGWHFTRNLSLEVDVAQFFGDFSDGKYATLNLVLEPFPHWRMAPYFALGGGMVHTEPKATLVQTEDSSDNLLDAGIGVRYYLTRRFLLRAQYKNYVVLTSRDTHEKIDEWKLAFSAFF